MPLKPGPSHLEENFHELRHGKQYARTAEEHGKGTARAQMIAIALKEARKHRADGGATTDALPDVGSPLIGSGPTISEGVPWANHAADFGSHYLNHVRQGIQQLFSTPGTVVSTPNPYPEGSEEHIDFENQRQDAVNSWSPAAALAVVTGSMPMAEEGALGMAGGRLRNQWTGQFRKAGETPLPGNAYRSVNTQAKPVAANSGQVVSDFERTRWAPSQADPVALQSNLAKMDNPIATQVERPPTVHGDINRPIEPATDVNPVDTDFWRYKLPNSFNDFSRGGQVAVRRAVSEVRRAKGGKIHTGAIVGDVGGRTDVHDMRVPDGAYVLSADVVSHLGQNNSTAGLKVAEHLFGKGGKYDKPEYRANGGKSEGTGKPVDCVTAGGEFVVPPEVVRSIGSGDIDAGHKILDHMSMKIRQSHIRTLQHLPGPAQD